MASVSTYPAEYRAVFEETPYRFDDLPEVEWKKKPGQQPQFGDLNLGKRVIARLKNEHGDGIGLAFQVQSRITAQISGVLAVLGSDAQLHSRCNNRLLLPQKDYRETALDRMKRIVRGSHPLLILSGPVELIPVVNVRTDGGSAENEQAAPTGLRWVAAQISWFFSAIWSLLAYLGNTLRSCCSRPANT